MKMAKATASVGAQDKRATMETNSYSIVSKRSVEKLYLRDEPQFLEPFVSNFKRRAPLINRGYWLRMTAIENEVRTFLQRSSSRRKVVVNLGCGYDPLPFRFIHQGVADDVLFVDVDYPELIQRKVDRIKHTATFMDIITSKAQFFEHAASTIALRSPFYTAVGADLACLEALEAALRVDLQIAQDDILFVAEVSITYMALGDADKLITWSSTFEHASFCVLEQFLPDPDHAFARTMLDHFSKQSAPLQSVMKYHSLDEHQARFRQGGWKSVTAQSLWHYWEHSPALDIETKQKLDSVEPFDEWEELILFASHYFLLVASNDETKGCNAPVEPYSPDGSSVSTTSMDQTHPLATDMHEIFNSSTTRRFGKAVVSSKNCLTVLGGITKCHSHETYSTSPGTSLPNLPIPIFSGHTVTRIDCDSWLLVGGRASPTKVYSRCFLFERQNGQWTEIPSIAQARHRHCAVAVRVRSQTGVLVFGGITAAGKVLDDWQVWFPDHGWIAAEIESVATGSAALRLFGAAMLARGDNYGTLIGGLDASKNISQISVDWHLSVSGLEESNSGRLETLRAQITLRLQMSAGKEVSRARFGAELISSQHGPLLIGGVGQTPLTVNQEVLVIDPEGLDDRSLPIFESRVRPLLVGMAAGCLDNGDIVIAGGGAVCFSFGQYIHNHWYHIRRNAADGTRLQLKRSTSMQRPRDSASEPLVVDRAVKHIIRQDSINVLELTSGLVPWFTKGVDAGNCHMKWDLKYLQTGIGLDTSISIHEGASRNLQFAPEKNFTYKTYPFSQFASKVAAGEHVYLRSLATQSPFQKPANIWRDYPSIAPDFVIPTFLNDRLDLSSKMHSSVLRVSGDVAIWLHYDVMSNFLFQIHGSKTVILYPPTEAVSMQFTPGATTSAVPIADIEAEAKYTKGRCRSVTLEPGDVLFIPRFWLHATMPASIEAGNNATASIAVNVFWRDLDTKAYAAGRDVYGSRDLAVYENGRKAIARIAEQLRSTGNGQEQAQRLSSWLKCVSNGKLDLRNKSHAEIERLKRKFGHLPKDVGAFYLPRLADELLQLLEKV